MRSGTLTITTQTGGLWLKNFYSLDQPQTTWSMKYDRWYILLLLPRDLWFCQIFSVGVRCFIYYKALFISDNIRLVLKWPTSVHHSLRYVTRARPQQESHDEIGSFQYFKNTVTSVITLILFKCMKILNSDKNESVLETTYLIIDAHVHSFETSCLRFYF